MKRCIVTAAAFFLLAATAAAAQPLVNIGEHLTAVSCNIKAARGYSSAQGSGTIILVNQKKGEPITFILTAHHVVDGLREVRTVTVDGEEKKQARYYDASVVQEQHSPDGSRVVGEMKFDAKVISVDADRDIALLRLRATGKFTEGVRFYSGDKVPAVATQVLHAGCPGGQEVSGTGAITSGIISRLGVRIADMGAGSDLGVYDHVSCPAMGGSSGGLVAQADTGEWIGMITLGLSNTTTFSWMVPYRSVKSWVEEIGAEWLLDPEATVTQEQIDDLPLENHGGAGKAKDEPTAAPKQRFVRMIETDVREIRADLKRGAP